MTRTTGYLMVLMSACTLTACMTIGHKFDIEQLDQLQPKVSSVSDATQLLGPATSETSYPDGSRLLQWQFSQGTPFGGKGAHAAVLFGQDGRMIQVVQRTNINL